MDTFGLTEEDVKKYMRRIFDSDTEESLKKKAEECLALKRGAEKYQKYKSNCKYVMETFGLTEEDIKEMKIYDDDTEESLKKKAEEYLSQKKN